MNDEQQVPIEQNIKGKVLWPLAIVILISFAFFLFVSNYFLELGLARTQEMQLQSLTGRYHSYMLERSGLMRSILQQLSRDKAIVAALERRDRPFLLQHSTTLFNELLVEQNITHFYYHTPDGTNLLRVHKPDRYGDLIDRATLHTAQRTNTLADGIELGPLGTFTLRSVLPIHNRSTRVGYIELGEDIGPIIDQLGSESGSQMAVLILKSLLDQEEWLEGRLMLNETADWDLLPEHVVTGTGNPQILAALPQLATGKTIDNAESVEVVLEEETYRGRFLNMMDVSGRSVGSLLVLQNVESILQDHKKSTLLITIFCAIMSVALFWIAANILGRVDKSLRIARENLTAAAACKTIPITLKREQAFFEGEQSR
ncbi:MAG: hypothetical protein IBX47_07395 [Desulfuromonadales bacterium]|nr:hypothetical protein [Desulfuromonadales bacterium]